MLTESKHHEIQNANDVCEFCGKKTNNIERIMGIYYRTCKKCWSIRKDEITRNLRLGYDELHRK